MLNVIIFLAVMATGGLLMMPRLAQSPSWRAMMTPLASIIGSGFLILGPVLNALYGAWAPLIMGLLCLVAWAFGAAVRYNIADRADDRPEGSLEVRLDGASSWALAFAYAIAVAYYLNLFGAFAVDLTPWNDTFHARLVTSAVFVLILSVGWTRGFSALEGMEMISVGIKLSIIAGLLVGLAWFFAGKAANHELVINPVGVGLWQGIALGFGLIVTVQGFETSRYLGANYDARTRITSMRWAQMLSAAIYMVYIGLISYVFDHQSTQVDEAGIIEMTRVVAPILPIILVAAALAAQFSAAVADTSGAGGLIAELTAQKLKPARAYGLLVAAGLLMTWTLDVFEIISYASRAFALYYALQSGVAASAAHRAGQRGRALRFALLALFGLVIVICGTPVE
ncbi:hypothetical protein [Albibacillus kandeliae]|uniref:hypothetical protein n=1 Tax=Albibacillus kandeliae TaxID=2174228 RepID=UPI000D69A3E8|nr:hypothetical protein [Albibacillus kandeliae]